MRYPLLSEKTAYTFSDTQDLNLFRVPADLDELLRVLIAILDG